MTALRDVPLLSRSRSTNSLLKPRLLSESTNNTNNAQDRTSNYNLSLESPEIRKPRQSRKPSPGLAARLRALGFGKDSASPSPPADRVGRIPEDQLRQLDEIHQANTRSHSAVPRRGRAWSGSTAPLTPQATGGSNYEDIPTSDTRILEVGKRRTSSITSSDEKAMSAPTEQMDLDSHKYRLPDHTNGNGTKTMSDTKQSHIERDTTVDGYSVPPTPISKDPPPIEFSGDVSSYFNPFGLHRTGSVYTLSRVSFADQLAQLTSLQLPDAESLSTKVSAIPTSKAASRALMGAAEQIRSWISKAYDVISGLDGDDDVEWAAAGGREGLEEVDSAITRFEELINVYVSAIESLQNRNDISTVPSDELTNVVLQVETILAEWGKIRKTLREVKNSVEIAMEWEELWNTVLGDIGNEMDILVRLVFEMEEKRHKSLMSETGSDGLDMKELENIVEEIPSSKSRPQANNRLSMRPGFPLSPSSPQPAAMAQDDSSLLALIARMQPLRASLDFLPMRLSTFHARAEKLFPTACEELETRREALDAKMKTLDKDAETLRKELGEDRWVLVFRGAGRQAQKMYESVDRSLVKLRESIEQGAHLNNPASMGKKIESYEAKKMHYGPAIERVLSIIDKGVKDRLTVNGEITRLHSDMERKWDTLKAQMSALDISIEEIQADKRNQQLRDSISSLVSNDRSTIGSLNDTPSSSPASSVVMTGFSRELDPSTPLKNRKVRPGTESHLPQPGRSSSASKQFPRRVSTYGSTYSPSTLKQNLTTPVSKRLSQASGSSGADGRPRWNSSVHMVENLTGHNFKPLSATTPSPQSRTGANGATKSESKIPLKSPLSTSKATFSGNSGTPPRPPASHLSYRDRVGAGPQASPTMRPRNLTTQSSMSSLSSANRRASLQPALTLASTRSATPVRQTRAASSLANTRRSSLLPQPRGRLGSAVTGRESPQAVAGAARAMAGGGSQTSSDSKTRDKKPWRP